MGNNGGKPTGTILTLEEALRRFARKRSEGGSETHDETAPGSNIRYADFSATVKREGEGTAGGDPKPADDSASAQSDEANARMPAGEDIIALIEGIPRTLEELEQMAAAEETYPEDLPGLRSRMQRSKTARKPAKWARRHSRLIMPTCATTRSPRRARH